MRRRKRDQTEDGRFALLRVLFDGSAADGIPMPRGVQTQLHLSGVRADLRTRRTHGRSRRLHQILQMFDSVHKRFSIGSAEGKPAVPPGRSFRADGLPMHAQKYDRV